MNGSLNWNQLNLETQNNKNFKFSLGTRSFLKISNRLRQWKSIELWKKDPIPQNIDTDSIKSYPKRLASIKQTRLHSFVAE